LILFLKLKKNDELGDNLVEAKDIETTQKADSMSFTPTIESEEPKTSSKSNNEDESVTPVFEDDQTSSNSNEKDSITPEVSIIQITDKLETNKSKQFNGYVKPVYIENPTPEIVRAMEMEEKLVKPLAENQNENLSIEERRGNVADWAVDNFVAPEFMA